MVTHSYLHGFLHLWYSHLTYMLFSNILQYIIVLPTYIYYMTLYHLNYFSNIGNVKTCEWLTKISGLVKTVAIVHEYFQLISLPQYNWLYLLYIYSIWMDFLVDCNERRLKLTVYNVYNVMSYACWQTSNISHNFNIARILFRSF